MCLHAAISPCVHSSVIMCAQGWWLHSESTSESSRHSFRSVSFLSFWTSLMFLLQDTLHKKKKKTGRKKSGDLLINVEIGASSVQIDT